MSTPNQQLCPQCKTFSPVSAAFCSRCGFNYASASFSQQRPNFVSGNKMISVPAGTHPVWVAPALSALLPGAGQMFNHQWIKGICILGGGTLLLSPLLLLPLPGILLMGVNSMVWIAVVADALLVAGRLHSGENITAWQCF